MRPSTALTTRGWSFLAAGIASVGCAVVLGYSELVRVGGFLIAVPLIALIFVRVARSTITAQRTITPHHVTAGATATVRLDITHTASLPTGTIALREEVATGLGGSPRFAVAPGRQRELHATYTLHPESRGAYRVGPATAEAKDPLGLAVARHRDASSATLIVTPHITPLSGGGALGSQSGEGEQQARSFATGTAEDLTVREYHYGDDLRRVHWRSSAKVGELMVRREEQPWRARTTVLLDNRLARHRIEAHHGGSSGSSPSFEWAVEVTASVAAHLHHNQLEVTLMTADGIRTTEFAAMLERLALVELEASSALGAPPETGLLVAVLGNLKQADLAPLLQLRARASVVWALTASEHDAAWLTSLGMRAAHCPPGMPLDDAWRRLASNGRLRGTVAHSPAHGQPQTHTPSVKP